jgi:hypothetical protein
MPEKHKRFFCFSNVSTQFLGPSPHLTEWIKGKAIPLQALTDPEGSRRLRLPDLKTIGT